MALAPWTIALAGGVGRRLASVTGGVPKQFWAPPGEAPLLACTIARLDPLVSPDRIVTVVAANQRARAEHLANQYPLGQMRYQPLDRGTAAGILLGLVELAARAADATVIVTPSDHGVASAAAWRGGLEVATAVVDRAPNEVVLFGAEATSAIGDYGWIQPVPDVESRRALSRVRAFVEKPPASEARHLLRRGAVWNTMVVVGRVRRLFDLFEARLPIVTHVFREALRRAPGDRASYLASRYPALPTSDFSMHVLQRTPGLLLYTWPASVGWTDLGTPGRLRDWLGGRQPIADGTGTPERRTGTRA